jgi:hypothetical protein
MNQATFNSKQQGKQIKVVEPPPTQQPDYLGMINSLKRQFDSFMPYLRKLRTGMWLIGSGSLSSGQLVISDNRVQATSICVANFSSASSIADLTTAHTHFLLTACAAGAATITSTDSADNNLVNYIIIF